MVRIENSVDVQDTYQFTLSVKVGGRSFLPLWKVLGHVEVERLSTVSKIGLNRGKIHDTSFSICTGLCTSEEGRNQKLREIKMAYDT